MNARRLRSALAGGCAGAVMLVFASPATPAGLASSCLPLMCKFSVSGKKGRYLEKQVTPTMIAAADAASSGNLTDGRSLDSVSLNKGANAGTGISMPKTEAALLEMLARIRAVWPYRAPPPISVRIVGTTVYGPTAKPDNVIVVPLGLLMHAQWDDEVAWVMAHEFSHIALAHFSREMKQRKLKGVLDQAVDCARLGMMLAETRARSSGNQIQLYQQENKGLRALSGVVWSRSSLVADFLEAYNQHLSRKQEDQADAAGLDLILAAKYSDEGYGTALTFAQADEARQATLFEQFGSEFGDYAKRAGGVAVVQMLKGGDASQGLKGFMSGLLRNAENLLFRKLMEAATSSHRPASKRKEGLGKYMDAAYKDVIPPDPTHSWLDAVKATPEYKEAEIAVNARDAARQALEIEPGEPTDAAYQARLLAAANLAIEKIQPAIKTRYASTPLIANTVAHLYAAIGNDAQADRLYDIADRGPPAAAAPARPAPKPAPRGRRGKGKAAPPPPAPEPEAPAPEPAGDPYLQQSLEGFSEHVDFLIARRNYAKALTVVTLAKTRFKDDDKFLPALITIYTQLKKQDALLETVKRCAATEDPNMRDSCDMAFLDPAQREKFDLLSPEDQDKLTHAMAYNAATARTGSTCLGPAGAAAKKKEEDDKDDD